MLKKSCNDINLNGECRMVKGGGAGRILVVDVDVNFRNRLRQVFEYDGFEVFETDSCQQMIKDLHTIAPDLVILEALLPNVDGFEACEALSQHANTRRIPVIMVTSLEDCDIIDWAFDLGVFDFMTKPVHETILRNRVRVLVNQAQENHESQDDHRQLQARFEAYEGELQKFKNLFHEELMEHKRTRKMVNHFKQAFHAHYPYRSDLREVEQASV